MFVLFRDDFDIPLQSVQWRVDNGYENLAKWTPPDLVREKWPIYPGGFDTENSPSESTVKDFPRTTYMH